MIAGDGSLRKALEDQRHALGLTEAVILTGHVADVIPLHHAFDLFVQSSDYEGTPNAVLEAMAMETPIVATEAGGTAEFVHDGVHGRIIPVGSVDRLIFGHAGRPRRPGHHATHGRTRRGGVSKANCHSNRGAGASKASTRK